MTSYLVVWSVPVDDLTDWRYDGVIFEYKQHTLFAPDVALVTKEDGSKTYLHRSISAEDYFIIKELNQ